MGQYDRHVFVCTSGETCPLQGDTEKLVKALRDGVRQAGKVTDVRINKAGCFSQCGHGPMIAVYPENVWYAGVTESDLAEIVSSHIVGGKPVDRLRYTPGVRGANKKPETELKAIEAGHAAAAAPAAPAADWQRVCRRDELPQNGMKEFPVNGAQVLLVHTDDAIVAFQPMCPHEAIPLEQGICDGSVLTCLEHMWQFDVKTGAPLGDAETGLKSYPVKDEGGTLYVKLAG